MPTYHQLPPLPYSAQYHALAPYIDAQTMELHHTKHHQGYVNKLNQALTQSPDMQPFAYQIDTLCKKIHPHTAPAIRNNAGGHYNHTLFWHILSPNPQKAPKGLLQNALEADFDSFDQFLEKFNQSAVTHFGSGWAWLIVNQKQRLEITTTPNQDNPLMPVSAQQGMPILGIDLWEHAYYLKYQNRRAAYVEALWHVIDWKAVANNYQKALSQL
ncbi:MAG: superoxide dismutase [Bacteroidota bacterium]